jgi:hypothetical protein
MQKVKTAAFFGTDRLIQPQAELDERFRLLTGQSVPILGLFRISRVLSSPGRIREPHGPPDLRSGKNWNHSIRS